MSNAVLDPAVRDALVSYVKASVGFFGALKLQRTVNSCGCFTCQTLKPAMAGAQIPPDPDACQKSAVLALVKEYLARPDVQADSVTVAALNALAGDIQVLAPSS